MTDTRTDDPVAAAIALAPQIKAAKDEIQTQSTLPNSLVEAMAEAVKLADGRAVTEASGGITLANVREVAATGVDIISVGGLTHSVKALDLSLDLL